MMTASLPTSPVMRELPTPQAQSSANTKWPSVCAVVPAFNRCDKTMRFLQLFKKIDYPNKKVIITDDGSSDNTFFNLQNNFPDVTVLRGNGNLWWSGGTNLAIKQALVEGCDYILTINDDCIMSPDFLRKMVEIAMKDPKYIVGCRIHREDIPEKVWSVGTTLVMKHKDFFTLNFGEKVWEEVKAGVPNPYPVDCMPGNGVLIPREVFERVGFYDEENMPQYHADSDLVLRARGAGFKPVIAIDAVLYNHIITEPLVNNVPDLIFSKKSDRYWRAMWTTLKRHGRWGTRLWMLWLQYAEFILPTWVPFLRG